ncbi:MAG: small multi-drug export protein [Candidatus Thalassarchaeaceae archaeon]|tara:strand:+ start:9463 stop:11625 length:2163 start_codon:yes stop_codon:yes gene_type:complete
MADEVPSLAPSQEASELQVQEAKIEGETIENIEVDTTEIDQQLDEIRLRREGTKRPFFSGPEGKTLAVGLLTALLFGGVVLASSTGVFMPDSISVDQSLSGTFLDPGEECVDRTGVAWLNIWEGEKHDLRIRLYNIDPSNIVIQARLVNPDVDVVPRDGSVIIDPLIVNGTLNQTEIALITDDVDSGVYTLQVKVFNTTDLPVTDTNQTALIGKKEMILEERQVEVLEIEKGGILSIVGLGEATTVKGIELLDDEIRSCWTVQSLGQWSLALMGAEWAGGRETAMLAGGSAGVPPWWMAFVSLFMSVVFLFIQYPLMYRFYHRDDEDDLSNEQTSRLIERTLEAACDELHIHYDRAGTVIEVKPLIISIDACYENTDRSFENRESVRAHLLKFLLSEFAVYGEMRSTELDVRTSHERRGVHQSIREGVDSMEGPVEDYTNFFTELNIYARIDDNVRSVVKHWFDQNPLHHIEDNVTSDDFAVYLRVQYKPANQVLSFLRNRLSYEDVQRELRKTIQLELKGMLGDRRVIVSAMSTVDTIADRVAAGRSEDLSVKEDGEIVATETFVAQQEGITGTLLQNQFVADILSSVEFIAHSNKKRIEGKAGFFGLIVFVWIPFMASGVLVGAMLGLVARMRFQRVLTACMIGGTAASITWAYTAQGIIEVMERYHAEALLPVIIVIVVLMAVKHVQNNKKHRQRELLKTRIASAQSAQKQMGMAKE